MIFAGTGPALEDVAPDRRDGWDERHDVPIVPLPTRDECAAAPLWSSYRRWLAALASVQAICAEPESPSWNRDDEYLVEDQEERLAAAGDLVDLRRKDFLMHVALKAGYHFGDPDAMARRTCGVVASVREGGRLFCISVDHEYAIEDHRSIAARFRPLVVDLPGGDPGLAGLVRPAGEPGEPIESPAIARCTYLFEGRLFAVESGVVAAADLEEVCPGWSDRPKPGWTVLPVHDVPGDLRMVQRLYSMTAEEFVEKVGLPMFTLPFKGANR